MKTTLHFITTTTAAVLALFCAVLAYQNAEPVKLSFFLAKSISLPLGFVLVSSIALGLVIVPILIPLLRQLVKPQQINQSRRRSKTNV
ncbi:MAG: lipopolysaccharide assembly protein LapA domain-containing protein [Alkalinema sp. CAN_BIN05]|nr:lipopolysaccharide assembly protein LapA domain-containing protein [Alkalinema sp. CAN_BIN05]